MQRSLEGCIVAQKGERAEFRRLHLSSEGVEVALRAQHSSGRVQHSSEGCSVAEKGKA